MTLFLYAWKLWEVDAMWWNHMAAGPGWLAMSLLMIVFWGALVYVIVYVVRGAGYESRPAPTDPKRLLDTRLARGEIDLTEYKDRIAALRDARHE